MPFNGILSTDKEFMGLSYFLNRYRFSCIAARFNAINAIKHDFLMHEHLQGPLGGV